MNRLLCWSLILGSSVLLLSGAGCSRIKAHQYAGKYFSPQNPKNFVELNSNGTFTAEHEGHPLNGKFRIEGDAFIISLNVPPQQMTINGGTITDSNGVKWIKE